MRALYLLISFAALMLSGQTPNQSRLEEMHSASGQTDQLPPELRKNAPRLPSITVTVALEGGESLFLAPLVMDSRDDETACRVANIFKNGNIRLEIPPPPDSQMRHNEERDRGMTTANAVAPNSCFLIKVMLPGYRSFSGTVRDQQVIVLARLGEHEGSTVSVTSLSVPDKARKAYERAEAALSKEKWAEAQKHLEQATSFYPAYAMAWSELGLALERQGKMDAATEACRKAVAADPNYIKPLDQLAALAGRQQHWEDERQQAAEALKLHPVEFPGVYYRSAEACFHLGRYTEAEKAARSTIEVDQRHEFPQAYLLLAAVLAQKGDRDAVVKELREYLKAAPHADNVGQISQQVARLTRDQAAGSVTAP
jgi:tetratricopeptide (TPR) repeat protein